MGAKTKVTLAANSVLWIIVLLFFLFGVFSRLSYTVYDLDMRGTMSRAPHEDIIVIGIDEESLRKYGQFPWERDVYVPFLQKVSEARVIAFDIMFNTDSRDKESDRLLAEELAKHDNVILATSLELETALSRTVKIRPGDPLYAGVWNKPIPELAEAAELAHIFRLKEPDGVVRRTHLMIDTPEGPVYSLAYRIAEMYGADVAHYLESKPKTEQMRAASPKTEQLIRFNAHSNEFMTIPFHAVEGMDPEFFRDRIVLVGITAPGEDVGTTPVDNAMYLVYVHANIVDQLLKGEEVSIAADLVLFGLIVLVLALTTWLTWQLKAIAGFIYLVAATVAIIAGQYGVFSAKLVFVDPVYPLFALYVGFLGNISIKTYYETKQKNYITKQFGRYISPDLVREIARSGKEIELGGINKELSILFLDVRGFTTLSEKLRPEEVVGFLNMMFDLITEKALENHGTIDKFIGDAAMILFNAPLDVPNHPYYAVKTAYDIQRGMESVRQQILDKYGVTISVGIGINTGEVVVGNIGSYLRVDYTAIGDNVNTAARIESQTKANQILVSEATFERTKEYFEYEFFDERMMKGKTVGIKLYEVKGHIKAPEEKSA